jgi:hypothetical protein
MQAWLSSMWFYAGQLGLDPSQGTSVAQRGAVQRLSEPNAYDVIFPGIAFSLVIVLPLSTALWVIYKTMTEHKIEPDET